jgi:hypothetical protein
MIQGICIYTHSANVLQSLKWRLHLVPYPPCFTDTVHLVGWSECNTKKGWGGGGVRPILRLWILVLCFESGSRHVQIWFRKKNCIMAFFDQNFFNFNFKCFYALSKKRLSGFGSRFSRIFMRIRIQRVWSPDTAFLLCLQFFSVF